MKSRLFTAFLALCLIICCAGCSKNAPGDPTQPGITIDPNIVALTVNGHQIRSIELNYFYVDAINEFINQYSSWITYILDVTKPLSQQYVTTDSDETWADQFLDTAIESAKNTYALYDAAKDANYALSPSEQDSIHKLTENLESFAKNYGFQDANAYLEEMYGNSATVDTYRNYYEALITASSYYNAYSEDLKESYTEVILQEFETDNEYKYNSYSYAYTYIEKKYFESENAMLQAVQTLNVATNNTVETLNGAIAALDKTYDPDNANFSTATEVTDQVYSNVNSLMQEWIRSENRQPGDITAIRNVTTGSGGSEVTSGYYIVLFGGVNENCFALANVRHILVAFQSSDGKTYSAEDKEKAKNEAQKIYDEWLANDPTEESFSALAKEHTDDGNGDVGGIYYDIYPGQMVQTFNDWCFGDRKSGDHGLVMTEYGYHIMYYSGDSETTYRNFMISSDKLSVDMEAWQKALLEAAQLEILDTSCVDMDYIINRN